MSVPETAAGSNFVIEDGVLKKYTGAGGSVVIPEGVTRIGERAFSKCESLTDIHFRGTQEQWEALGADIGRAAVHCAGDAE